MEIDPCERLSPLSLCTRDEINEIKAVAILANLPNHIALRELKVIGKKLGISEEYMSVRREESAKGPGNAISVFIKSPQLTEVFTGFGQRGIRAETVASRVVKEVHRYLDAGVPVGEHLADQLLLPLALSSGGSMLTLRPSLHAMTNIKVIERFLEIHLLSEEISADVWHFTVRE